MFIKLLKNVGKEAARAFVTRENVQSIKKYTGSGVAVRSACFHAISANEMDLKTPLPDIEYVVYYAEKNALSHYNMWNPVFSKRPGTHASIFRLSAGWWSVNDDPHVYPISTMAQIEPLLNRMPNLKAVFYPANNGANMQVVRNTDLTHVFLGHGDSNKASSANKCFRLYDEVWVAGQAHRDRFDRVSGDYSALKFPIVGQPWMQDWFKSLPKYGLEERNQWGYFPTWRGYYANTNYSSLDIIKGIAAVAQESLGDTAAGFLKLHPWSTNADVKAVSRVVEAHKPPQITKTIDENGEALSAPEVGLFLPDQGTQLRDILKKPLRFVVCDISAAVTECLFINVPIFLYYPQPPALVADDFEERNAFCYLYRNVDELKTLLKRVIVDGDDYLAEERAQAMNYRVDLEKTANGQFYKELDRLPKIKG